MNSLLFLEPTVDSRPLELKSSDTFSSMSSLGGGVLCSSGTGANPASFGFKERFSKNSYLRKQLPFDEGDGSRHES